MLLCVFSIIMLEQPGVGVNVFFVSLGNWSGCAHCFMAGFK